VQLPETQTGVGFDKTALADGIERRLKPRKRLNAKTKVLFIGRV
jgi:hypothetical protein